MANHLPIVRNVVGFNETGPTYFQLLLDALLPYRDYQEVSRHRQELLDQYLTYSSKQSAGKRLRKEG